MAKAKRTKKPIVKASSGSFFHKIGNGFKKAGRGISNFFITIAGPAKKTANNGATTLFFVVALLTILSLVTGAMLSIQLSNYIKEDEMEVSLTHNIREELEMFSCEYRNWAGDITVKGAHGQKVIAPGTSVDYTIYLRNSEGAALDYQIIPEVSYTSEIAVPIVFRLMDDQGNYVIGDAATWLTVSQMQGKMHSDTLLKGETTEYYFQWKWAFESGNDQYDTWLGEIANEKDLGVKVSLTLSATENTQIGEQGGVEQEFDFELGNVILNGASFLLSLVACVFVTIMFVKRTKR